MRIICTWAAVAGLLLVGCHFDMDAVPYKAVDRGAPDRASPDRGPATDVWSFPDTQRPPDLLVTEKCVIGTPDHCTACGDKCPGKDDGSTKRICSLGKCNIVCRGDYYDVNGKLSDGCEVEDVNAQYDSQSAAKNLGSMDDCGNVGKSTVASLPSDNRYHETSPHYRPLGTAKWFKTYITDKSGCLLDFKITLDATSLPAKVWYKLDPLYLCQTTKTLPLGSKSGEGSTKIVMSPVVKCSLGSDDSGTMFVKVNKAATPTIHSIKPFWLTIKP